MSEFQDVHGDPPKLKVDTTIETGDTLIIVREVGGNPTEVPDEDCNTPEKLLSWILYFAPRQWVTTEFLEEFIQTEISRHSMKVEQPLF